jgi:hypothetical protein
MTRKPNTTTIIAAATVSLVAGMASYVLFRTYSAVKKLEEIDLDFGNDEGLLSTFKRKDNK